MRSPKTRRLGGRNSAAAWQRGIHVRLPRPGATWEPLEHPLPFTADELSKFVVELRRAGKL